MTDKRIRMECPFCHIPAERVQLQLIGKTTSPGRIWFVYCPECGAQTKHSHNKQEAIDAWNRR